MEESIISDKLQGSVANVFDFMVSFLSDAQAFAKDQIPDLIQQFLMWKIVSNSLTLVFCVIGLVFILKVFKKIKENYSDANTTRRDNFFWCTYGRADSPSLEAGGFFAYLFSIIALLFCVVGIGDSIFTIAKLVIAPKLYLLEYAIELVKTVKK